MNNKIKKVEDIKTSEILGTDYRKNHPIKNPSILHNILIILIIVCLSLFCFKNKLYNIKYFIKNLKDI